MLIELLCRFEYSPTSEEKENIEEELKTIEIIKGGSFDYDREYAKIIGNKYTYLPMIINLNDIYMFNYYDEEHITIRFTNNDVFVFKVDYKSFLDEYAISKRLILKTFINNGEYITEEGTTESPSNQNVKESTV